MTGKGLREVLTRVFDLERSRPNPRGEGQEPSAALRNRVHFFLISYADVCQTLGIRIQNGSRSGKQVRHAGESRRMHDSSRANKDYILDRLGPAVDG
jgi:hypothetical protein